jgi:outer membrane murein-binding lipoprotein Lpp
VTIHKKNNKAKEDIMTQLLKNPNSLLAAVIVITATLFLGCNSPQEKVDEVQENAEEQQQNLDQAQVDLETETANFKMESNEKITANEKVIADFKTGLKSVKDDAKATYEKQVAVLEQKNAALKKRIEEQEDEGMEKWQSFKIEFNHDMDELGKSLKDFTINNKK